MIEILESGALTTVQDLGRPGLAALGVSQSGAADRKSFRLANRLAGNPESAAGLEITLGGFTARFTRRTLIAVTGARCPLWLDRRAVDMYGPIAVAPGQRIHVGQPAHGLRSYLAVRGGVDVPPTLGSRSTDQLAGLGPAPVRAGDFLPVGSNHATTPCVDIAPQPSYPEEPVLTVLPGPRDDWFTDDALSQLCSRPYEVTAQSNRVGVRLSGPVLSRNRHQELPSEPMVRGALQVPPDGQPVLFLVDHPVTGGYPVIGVVTEGDFHLAAQARPGQRVGFRLARQSQSRAA